MNAKLLRLAVAATLGATLLIAPAWGHGGHQHNNEKRHHNLRGTIKNIDASAGTFEVNTGHKTAVLCYLDAKSRVLRDGKDIRLEDIKEGERVLCKCSEHTGDRHYSLELLVETPKKERR